MHVLRPRLLSYTPILPAVLQDLRLSPSFTKLSMGNAKWNSKLLILAMVGDQTRAVDLPDVQPKKPEAGRLHPVQQSASSEQSGRKYRTSAALVKVESVADTPLTKVKLCWAI